MAAESVYGSVFAHLVFFVEFKFVATIPFGGGSGEYNILLVTFSLRPIVPRLRFEGGFDLANEEVELPTVGFFGGDEDNQDVELAA
jgi:hypothetical protein